MVGPTQRLKILYFVVGIGSAGEHYLGAIQELGEKFIAVETDTVKATELAERGIEVLDTLPACTSTDDIVILATRARGRAEKFRQIASLGYRKVLLEKLLADNLNSLFEIQGVRKDFGVLSISHSRWELMQIHSNIIRIAEEKKMGKVLSISIVGGNFCAAAGGIHLLSLAHRVHDFSSMRVDLNRLALNEESPRGGGLKIVSGRVAGECPATGFEFYADFNPRGKLAPSFSVYFERGRIHFELGRDLVVSSCENSERQYELSNHQETYRFAPSNPFREALLLLKGSDSNVEEIESSWESSVAATKLLLELLTASNPSEIELPVT